METGGRGAAVSGGRAAAGGCGRKARAAAGTLAVEMDLHCDRAAEPPAAEPPSGKINKAAFKLFKKRKPGGAMPSIFGVKHKGDGKGAGPAGLVRSRTHDGLADISQPHPPFQLIQLTEASELLRHRACHKPWTMIILLIQGPGLSVFC